MTTRDVFPQSPEGVAARTSYTVAQLPLRDPDLFCMHHEEWAHRHYFDRRVERKQLCQADAVRILPFTVGFLRKIFIESDLMG